MSMTVKLEVPSFGESITEVVIEEWLVEEGARVERDQPVVSIESDKATLEVPAPSAGVLRNIRKRAGDPCEVGETIAEIDEAGSSDATPGPDKAERAEKTETAGAREELPMGPAVRRLLAEHDLDPQAIRATGKDGRLLKEDVQRHLDELRTPPARPKPAQPAPAQPAPAQPKPAEQKPAEPAGGERRVPMSPIRKVIARRLVEATQTTAMLTTFNEIDMARVIALRSEYKQHFVDRHGVKLGFMSFFVKASIEALRAYPNVNAEIRGDDIIYKDHYHVGVAVGTGKGLTVPVIFDADRRSFAELERTIADYGQRAQQNRLKLEELQGGTFTISNGGIYGSMLSTPILNPPQSGILGMHNIVERAVVRDGQIVVRPMMYVALTYDHRLVDGREAVGFLYRIKETIESPERMLLEV
jgi:2-oxoglutarate dehydrogenase E2 component (dihydrolipoamide succinyltransferase)